MRWSDPWLASLHRHRLVAGLMLLQAATTAVLLALALARIGQLQAQAAQPSGADEARLMWLLISGRADPDGQAREQRALAAVPGVQAALRVNQVPFGPVDWQVQVSTQSRMAGGSVPAGLYFGDEGLRQAFGARLRAGRDLLPADYPLEAQQGAGYAGTRQALISQALAQRLFPRGDALGRAIYYGTQAWDVVGIYDRLSGADPAQACTLILPLRQRDAQGAGYLLRLAGDVDRGRLPAAVAAAGPGR